MAGECPSQKGLEDRGDPVVGTGAAQEAGAGQSKGERRLREGDGGPELSPGPGGAVGICAALGFCLMDFCPHSAHPETSSSRTTGISEVTPY